MPVRAGFYGVLKQRPDRIWLDSILFVATGAAIVLGTIPNELEGWESLVLKTGVAILAFIAGRLYAPVALKRAFPGREGQS
jgi:hypothetical protein